VLDEELRPRLPAVQRAQLSVGELARILPLERCKYRPGLQVGVRFYLGSDLFPDMLERIGSRSPRPSRSRLSIGNAWRTELVLRFTFRVLSSIGELLSTFCLQHRTWNTSG
jgi:hypothetical protein